MQVVVFGGRSFVCCRVIGIVICVEASVFLCFVVEWRLVFVVVKGGMTRWKLLLPGNKKLWEKQLNKQAWKANSSCQETRSNERSKPIKQVCKATVILQLDWSEIQAKKPLPWWHSSRSLSFWNLKQKGWTFTNVMLLLLWICAQVE